eukprot:COSAG04_NODE_760_length_10536_cov_15.103564_1_plen_183_part_00
MYSLLWPLALFATATSLGRTSSVSPPPAGVVAPSGGPASGFRAGKSGNMAAQLGRNPYFLHLLVCSMGRKDKTERKGSRGALPEAKHKKKRAVHCPGIEPGSHAWEASMIPLHQQCAFTILSSAPDNHDMKDAIQAPAGQQGQQQPSMDPCLAFPCQYTRTERFQSRELGCHHAKVSLPAFL